MNDGESACHGESSGFSFSDGQMDIIFDNGYIRVENPSKSPFSIGGL